VSAERLTLLLVEDDQRLASLTAQYLEQNHFHVVVEDRGDRALAKIRKVEPDLVVLDLMLPGMDGLEICAELRKTSQVPVLMLTAKGTDLDQVVGLSAGADDYVVKPVDPMVLLARVQALLRGVEVELSTQEFELLFELARNAGTVLSREALFRSIRGIDYDGMDRSIDVRVSRLRKKLGDSEPPPRRIKTVWGKGYLLVPHAW